MSLVGIKEAVLRVEPYEKVLTMEEKRFIYQFAFQTEDVELITMLISDLTSKKEEVEAIITRYEAICDEKLPWIRQMEDLLVALEVFRREEKKAMQQLAQILSAYGIDVSEEKLRQMDTKELEESVKEKAEESRLATEKDKDKEGILL